MEAKTVKSSPKPAGPPYMAWTTLENLIERMEKDGVPGRIDRSVLTGSEGYKTQVLAGLRWLGLIDSYGAVTPTFEQLVTDSANRQERVATLFQEKYSRQIGLGKRNASQRELEESFEPYGGDTARKAVSFYLKGARFAGLPISAYFKMPRARRASSKSSKPRKPRAKGASGNTGSGALEMADLHPALTGLLNDIPRGGRGWTEEERETFVDAFQVMIKYAVPIIESTDTEVEEGEEPQE